MPVYLLLAMQAAGMITDYFGAKAQQQYMQLGADVEQAGIEANIEMNRLQTEDESLEAMRKLRQNLGTQIATYAARGTALGAGSSVNSIMESVSNFKADERMRRLNAMGKENQLRGGAAISRLNYMTENNKLWQGFAQRTFNRLPGMVSGAKGIGSQGFGLTSLGS